VAVELYNVSASIIEVEEGNCKIQAVARIVAVSGLDRARTKTVPRLKHKFEFHKENEEEI